MPTTCMQVVSAFRTVFSFANEDIELQRYTERINKHYELNVKQVTWAAS